MSPADGRWPLKRLRGNRMTTKSKGRDLFIVDNRVFGWTGRCYLEEWSGMAK
jgi:hypothetical protein